MSARLPSIEVGRQAEDGVGSPGFLELDILEKGGLQIPVGEGRCPI